MQLDRIHSDSKLGVCEEFENCNENAGARSGCTLQHVHVVKLSTILLNLLSISARIIRARED